MPFEEHGLCSHKIRYVGIEFDKRSSPESLAVKIARSRWSWNEWVSIKVPHPSDSKCTLVPEPQLDQAVYALARRTCGPVRLPEYVHRLLFCFNTDFWFAAGDCSRWRKARYICSDIVVSEKNSGREKCNWYDPVDNCRTPLASDVYSLLLNISLSAMKSFQAS